MKITVNVSEMDLGSVIGDEIKHYDEDSDSYETTGRTLADLIADRLAKAIRESDSYPPLKQRVTDARAEVIREMVRPEIERVMGAPVQKTNRYGEPTGQATTMRELILAEVKAFMEQPADTYSREKGTVLQAWLRQAVEKTIKTELAEVLAEEKAKVVAAVRGKAGDLIAQAVREGLAK